MLLVDEIIHKTMIMCAKEIKGRDRSQSGERRRKMDWSPPPNDIMKVNIDVEFLKQTKKGAWGFIVRDHEGRAVLVGAGNLNVVHDALCAEIEACLAALGAVSQQV